MNETLIREDVYDAIFAILDNIPEIDGEEAGRIATLAEELVIGELPVTDDQRSNGPHHS